MKVTGGGEGDGVGERVTKWEDDGPHLFAPHKKGPDHLGSGP
jgi:hypothetical protein